MDFRGRATPIRSFLKRHLGFFGLFVMFVGLHVTGSVSWRELAGIGIFLVALIVMKEAERFNKENDPVE